MYQCPERAKRCKDVNSDGTYKKRQTCFNCLGPHNLAHCTQDLLDYWWRISKNKKKFFEALDNGTEFVGIAASPTQPSSMPPPAPITPSKFDIHVRAKTSWTDSRLTSFKQDFETQEYQNTFDDQVLIVHGVPEKAVGKLMCQIRDGKDADGESWDDVSRKAIQVATTPFVDASSTSSTFDQRTEDRFKAIESTQEELKGQVSDIRSSVTSLEKKIDTNQQSVNSKLDMLIKNMTGSPAGPPVTPSKEKHNTAGKATDSSASSRSRDRMSVDENTNETPAHLTINTGDKAWAVWGVGSTCHMDEVQVCSYGEERDVPGYLVQLCKQGTCVGTPFFVESGHVCTDRESAVPIFERSRSAKRQTRGNSRQPR